MGIITAGGRAVQMGLAALVLLVAAIAGSVQAQETGPGSQADVAFWNSVKDSKNAAEIKAYLEAFPKGTFAELAKIRIKTLEQASAAPVPAAPAPPPKPSAFDPTPPAATASVLVDTATIREVQDKFYNLNYEISIIDGRLTAETRAAIRQWQQNTKQVVTGDMNASQLARLRSARIPTQWGALAYAARGASGTVWNRNTRQEAERDALDQCKKNGGTGCKLVTAAGNVCGALGFYTGRVGSQQHFGAYASVRPTLAQAIDNALSECRSKAKKPDGCGVRITFCADGSHKK